MHMWAASGYLNGHHSWLVDAHSWLLWVRDAAVQHHCRLHRDFLPHESCQASWGPAGGTLLDWGGC